MKLLQLLSTALRALRVNLLRSMLTMLGIIIGVSAVIIMVSLGAGAQQQKTSVGVSLLFLATVGVLEELLLVQALFRS